MPSSHPGSALLSSFARRRLSLSAFSWLALCAIAASCAPASNAEPSAGDEDARAAAYDSALSVGGYEAALSRIDPTEPGPDPIDEPTGPTVSVATQSAEWISLGIRTAPGTNELYRSVGSGARAKLATLASSATGYVDRAVTDGTTYCYELKNTSGAVVKWSNRACGRTLFAQYRFTGLGIPQSESDSIVAHFDWHRTEALYAGGAEPQLWYMNVLIDAPDSLRVLRAAGVHAQSTPVFEAERNALAPHATLPSTGGVPAGMWVYAIVPAPLYNDMRAQMIARADAGQAQIFRAAVFRSVPDAAARVWSNTAYSPLSYQHLAEQGLEYNGETAQECYVVNGERVCALRREIVGWLGRKIFHFVAELIEDVVDDVRLAWGKYKRIVKGEATLSLDFAVHNTDTAFAGNLQSGWAERAILLKNLRVKVYQGFAGFYGTTNANGTVQIKVAKGRSGRVCIELSNQFVEFLDIFTEREVCVGTVPAISADAARTIDVTDNYVNSFMQMTDAAEYVERLTGQRMSRVTVMTGSLANMFTTEARSFAPCLGRWPNLSINTVAYALPVIATVAAEIAEFMLSVDIVLDTSSMQSRGVGTHEYSHTVMCEIMHDASFVDADYAWADLIMHISSQSVENEQTYIVEGFADFLTAQIAGGMNYVPLENAKYSLKVHYSTPGSQSAETNLTGCSGCAARDAFDAQVGRVATLLFDAFDGTHEGEGFANDAALWKLQGEQLVLDHIHDHSDDDGVELRGPQLFELFDSWSRRGNTLRESSFLGALGVLMVRAGHDRDTVCGLFGAHAENGQCPSYIADLFSPLSASAPVFSRLD